MDDYGTCGIEDAEVLKADLARYGAIAFPYSHDRMSCYIIYITKDPMPIGTMPWGGPIGKYVVALKGMGHAHDFDAGQRIHATYLSEKLDISITDAHYVLPILSALLDWAPA
jgi:hypothetical protein